jgi:TetR/AcrR family transcriptional repressor of nem operon
MRKSREETAQTRQRILAAAAAEFRRGGIDSTGVADVMAAAGLTQGGFYRHFESKDALVRESLGGSLNELRHSMEGAIKGRPGRAGVVAAIDDYLSLKHLDSPSPCPFACLGSELARESPEVREAATAGFKSLMELVASRLTGLSAATSRKEAAVILSSMVGAMTVARMVSDRTLATAILAQTRKSLSEQVRDK